MNPKLIWLIVKIVIWIILLSIGFYYTYSAIGGASISYNSLTDFLTAIGACQNGQNCDISGNACFLCPYIKTLINLISNASTAMYDIFIDHTWILLVMGFALFILFHTKNTLQKNITENFKIDGKERKFIEFNEYFEPIKKQGFRLLIIGALLGVFSINKTESMVTISKITIKPIMFVGNYIGTTITGNSIDNCPNTSEIQSNLFSNTKNFQTTKTANELTNTILNPFLCTVGNLNTTLLAGAAGGFSLMNFGWMDNSIFVWIAGFALVLLFMITGFHLIFDLINIIMSVTFLIMFIPLIIASYAFDYPILKGLGQKSLEILTNAFGNTIKLTLQITILYIIVLFPADKYFPEPLDGYTAIFPPELGFNLSNKQAQNLKNKPQISKLLEECSTYAKNSEGLTDKDSFKKCYNEKKSEYPEAFSWTEKSLDFFLILLGSLIVYWIVIKNKINAMFKINGNFSDMGDKLYETGKTGLTATLKAGEKIFLKIAKKA